MLARTKLGENETNDAFVIGWHSHYVHCYPYGYYGHPYYGHTYYNPLYVRNNVNVNVTHGATSTTNGFANAANVAGLAGIKYPTDASTDPANWGPPNLIFSSGIAALADAQRSLTRDQTSGVSGSFFSSRGSHNLRAGAGFRRQQFNYLSQQDPRGTFTFTGAATQGSANGVAVGGSFTVWSGVLLRAKSGAGVPAGNAVDPLGRGCDREEKVFVAVFIKVSHVAICRPVSGLRQTKAIYLSHAKSR